MTKQKQVRNVTYTLFTLVLHFSSMSIPLFFSAMGIDLNEFWQKCYTAFQMLAYTAYGGVEDLLSVVIVTLASWILSFCLMIWLLSELRNEKISPLLGKILVSINLFTIISLLISALIQDLRSG